jgi:hypothetical protein
MFMRWNDTSVGDRRKRDRGTGKLKLEIEKAPVKSKVWRVPEWELLVYTPAVFV